ncbi:unnamed protein product [Prorocentrum cordatum]|uniref:Uncharacterized protein n=1 Tax=Prorocentrum cordatum TaxID=2364126 RepID=A0ABN9VCL9_9DINO|nr:unnamed protein product [Polarella glacialis]
MALAEEECTVPRAMPSARGLRSCRGPHGGRAGGPDAAPQLLQLAVLRDRPGVVERRKVAFWTARTTGARLENLWVKTTRARSRPRRIPSSRPTVVITAAMQATTTEDVKAVGVLQQDVHAGLFEEAQAEPPGNRPGQGAGQAGHDALREEQHWHSAHDLHEPDGLGAAPELEVGDRLAAQRVWKPLPISTLRMFPTPTALSSSSRLISVSVRSSMAFWSIRVQRTCVSQRPHIAGALRKTVSHETLGKKSR